MTDKSKIFMKNKNYTPYTQNLLAVNSELKLNTYKIGKDDKYYEIYKHYKLGEGTYSSVCLGKMINKTNSTEQLVAVKKIIKANLSSRGLTMLSTEIEIIKEMISHNHENIIKCYDVVDDIDVIYIITEYCEDGDFSSLLTGKPLKYKYVKYYFGQIVKALKYLNDKNIIHRDIKPKNILVTNKGHTIKLCDFGFAKHSDGLKKIMTMCGSPLYMAPEIYQKTGYTISVDVWALGMILYEMLFGSHPFKNYNDPQKLAESIINLDIKIPIRYDEMDTKCLELLSLMLQRKEMDRIKISELFENEWIKDCMNTSVCEDIDNNHQTEYQTNCSVDYPIICSMYEDQNNNTNEINNNLQDCGKNHDIHDSEYGELSLVFTMDD